MKFLPIALALAFLVTPAAAIDMSKETPSTNVEVAKPTCWNKQSMFDWAKAHNKQVWTLTKEGQDKLRNKVNMNRSRNNKEPLSENSEFFFVPLVDQMNDGITYFSDGCAVDEMSMLVDAASMAKIFLQAGVAADEIVKAVE